MGHLAFFQKHDKVLAKIIDKPIQKLQRLKNIPVTLMRSIMNQQLNSRAADAIYGRFLDLYDGKKPTPQQVSNTTAASLRSIGISKAKVSYVHNVAKFFIEHDLTDRKLNVMPNEELTGLLTQIKGVGQWTVEILLMFSFRQRRCFLHSTISDCNKQ